MFNHKNTPSSFLRKNNLDPRSSFPKRSDGWKNVDEEIKSSKTASSSCSVDDEERGYQCVSVSTRWSWDDIFTTVNTTEAEGIIRTTSVAQSYPDRTPSIDNCKFSRFADCYVKLSVR